MKILFYSNTLTPYQIDFLKELNKFHKILSIFTEKTLKNNEWKFTTKYFPILKNKKFKEIKEKINNFDPDIVIIGGYKLKYIFRINFFFLFKKTKIIYWLEIPRNQKLIINFLKKIYIKIITFRAKIILCVGLSAKKFYLKLLKKKTVNFPYSINVDKYKIKKKTKKTIKVLFVGQLIKRKGILELLKAFDNFKKEKIELIICGNGPLKNDIIKKINNNNKIKYKNFLQEKKLFHEYSNSDIFILPSKYDGWGVVISEAMASGLPIIATKETNAAKYLVSKKNGFLCRPNAKSIFLSLNKYIKNKKLIEIHSKNSKNLINKSICSSKNSVLKLNSLIS
ncbi:glycosyltransferase [Candidatus Pelagibacter sp. HIMB1517]|uniref:glycosyltransferase n=1 Tax=Candidatus Pelagibacter sp. HIMB1517 TaxID=3413341 RepID=UPI003F82FA91